MKEARCLWGCAVTDGLLMPVLGRLLICNGDDDAAVDACCLLLQYGTN